MRHTMPYTNREARQFDAFIEGAQANIATERGRQTDDPNCSRSIGVGIVLGLVVGAILGVAMLLYVDSVRLNQWAGTPSLIVSSAFGWALFGMIVGSGGVFSRLGVRSGRRR